MRLALELGRYNVDAMLEEAGHEQLAEWMAYERIEPFHWRQASMVASVIANELRLVASGFSGNKMKEDDLYTLDAFVPGANREKRKKETDSALKSLDAMIGL